MFPGTKALIHASPLRRLNCQGYLRLLTMSHALRGLKEYQLPQQFAQAPKAVPRRPVPENGSFISNSLTTCVCLILSFLAAPRLLLNCPYVPRTFRPLSHLRKPPSRSLLPPPEPKALRRLLHHQPA